MTAMGQGTETCTDRPSEVSVIRFVSRNRTIEEIAPKKEVYMCKEQGCGKKFTNQDEYKTHETLEALKIRFICREPGCGEELSDPGSMWRHYQEWHNNETNVFVCPYTNCSSVHATGENLEEHIELCHRQPVTLTTEPEIICFEGPENAIKENSEERIESFSLNPSPNFPKNEDLLITKDNFLMRKGNDQDKVNIVFVNDDVTITKSVEKNVEVENLEEGSNCSEDEEYTPKKQRMSRHKQDSYKCDISGCGKMYKYISTYRHHQDSHKLSSMNATANSAKSQKPKQRKASTVSFFLCKMPGCGAQVDNVNNLWKHYQDNHASLKLPTDQVVKNSETLRCNVPGCDMEFGTNFMLYKHFSELHSNNSNASTKTGNGAGIHFANHMFREDAASPQINFKTDLNAKQSDSMTDYEDENEKILSLIVKEELRD